MTLQELNEALTRKRKQPTWLRWVLISSVHALLFYILTLYSMYFLGCTGILMYIVLAISAVLGFIVPLLSWPERHLGKWSPWVFLLFWFLAMYFAVPLIAKPIYVSRANEFLPPYSALTLKGINIHNNGNGASEEPSVQYVYETNNVMTDYAKMRDFYKEYLGQRGWTVDRDDESGSDKVITFANQKAQASIEIYMAKYSQNHEINVFVQR